MNPVHRLAGISIVLVLHASAGWSSEAPTSGPAADAPAPSYHPVVPAFERFSVNRGQPAANDDDDDVPRSPLPILHSPVEAGRLLLGELNCTSCHRAGKELSAVVSVKQAPVLDGVGARVKPEYLRRFLSSPHQVKPGTTMPDLFAGLSDEERSAQVEALVQLLASTGSIVESLPEPEAVTRGRNLFHRVGCTACHDPRRETDRPLPTSVPLGHLDEKYTLSSLSQFLRDPHKVRPSGRMPNLNLDEKQAADVANYFFQGVNIPPNVRYAYFEGDWDKIPDFATMTPKSSGETVGFDLNAAVRKNNFGMRFTGFLHVPADGEYTFFLGSDDGSRLVIDGQTVVDNDGIHPHSEKSGKAQLIAGPHELIVDYIQGGGEWTLTLAWQTRGGSRQSVAAAVSLTNDPPRAKADKAGSAHSGVTPNAELIENGRRIFATAGCAACHQLQMNGQAVKSELAAKPLDQLDAASGCLAETLEAQPSPQPLSRGKRGNDVPRLPQYRLAAQQREALAAALKAPLDEQPPSLQQTIARTMATFNCYACHARDKIGGPETARNELFLGTIPEMGDEGRIPPPLDGVGDKLTENWLRHVLNNGAKDRPYMHTQMPRFGNQNVQHVAAAFKAIDEKSAAEFPQFDKPEYRVKADGRHLVGDQALSCIKCHYFDKHKATGIQAIDLTTMTQRLRPDWFQRYMLNPQEYRPGTRMPAAWPFGQATVKEILDADTTKQIAAVWLYLADGKKSAVPAGLVASPIELKPETEPVIYRNFIEGVSPRGIAVGYPEHANLAFDAEQMSLRLVWHGKFIDASLHWNGRGVGFQPPLGDHVYRLVGGVPFATLENADSPWPDAAAKEQGYRFGGYRLDTDRRPAFLYRMNGVEVEDLPLPFNAQPDPGIERTLTLKGDSAIAGVWYRAAAGKTIERTDGWYVVDGALRLQIASAAEPVIRGSGEGRELLVPVTFNDGRAVIVQRYVW